MLAPYERRNRRKLLISAVTLAGVLIVAGIAQRNHRPGDPFPSEGTRARTERPAAAAPDQRPVFGSGTSRPDPLSMDPLPRETPAAAASDEQPPEAPAKRDAVPADVLGVVERWRSSLERRDLETHVNTYAPRVDRFFRQRRVSREAVQREKVRMLERYPHINKYEIHDVKLESMNKDRAVVTFRKDWDTSGDGSRRFAGSERQRLTLRRTGGEWKIVSEEELKVHWVRRS
jgi:ketosteroid isomerase-like protein